MNSEAVVTFPNSQPQPRPRLAQVERVTPLPQFDCFIGVSAHLTELKEFIRVQASSLQPVLLIGERGLRREQIARALHLESEHREQPFFAVNARALGEDALHQLLFGPRGMVEKIRRGAIYVNELTGLPLLLQQRFAAYIEEQRWRARSGRRPAQRLIFATEYDPASRNAENRLAYSLIEQLRSSSFTLKPLRERSEDIPYLINHFASRIARSLGREEREIANEAMRKLVEYTWEQNIDELESVIESMLVYAPPLRIEENMLPDRVCYSSFRTIPPSGIDLPTVVGDYERSLIETALRQTGGNQTKAGQLLGLRVQTLNMKLKRFAELNKPIILPSEKEN
ncbi:MAG: sigma 54-interacting transcriptional regulator [Acidobacteria bacterium]|nr:sigma 54-interacting transcriptional regulator [Acidobacteriota bacterium]